MRKVTKKTWEIAFLIAVISLASFNVISACQTCDDVNNEYSSQMVGMMNPAAVYCAELGYEYKTVQTEQGERGICVIPETGEEFDAWDFLEGKVGQKYSYCSTIDCDTITVSNGKNSFSADYAICIPRHISATEHSNASFDESMSVTNLLKLEEKVFTNSFLNIEPDTEFCDNQNAPPDFNIAAPSLFDWRDKDGENWVTPVKDQKHCGSCWAFASTACVEAKVNIVMNDPDFDVDLSEQYLVSDCCAYCGDCSGGYISYTLNYIRNHGITDEWCYPYTASDSLCLDRCSLWDKRMWTINSYGWPYGPSYTKDFLIEKGPLIMYIGMNGKFDYNGIYRCNNPTVNHGVLLVGYNDTGEYWIAKNSWGSGWNDDGYFKVGYGECSMNVYAPYYIEMLNEHYNYPLPLPNPTPTPVPLPIPPETPDPVPLPELMTIPLPIPLPFFIPIPLPIPLP